jgi:hypothetical protein
MSQATLVVRTQNNRIRAYTVSDMNGVYFHESHQLGHDLFHGRELVSWEGDDIIVDLRIVDERGHVYPVAYDAVAQELLIH